MRPADRSFHPASLARAAAAALLVAGIGVPGHAAAELPRGVASKLDPRLLPAALATDSEPLSVWVEFRDKGEVGPADLAARLATAEAALTPRARARRLRARVRPLVDERDLPVHPAYLDALRAQGFSPYGVSRWLNRAALRAGGARLAALAAFDFVQSVRPIERMVRSADPPAPDSWFEAPATPGPALGGAERSAGSARGAAIDLAPADYGRTFAMLSQMNVPAVHDSGYVGTGVLVCVLDEGFNFFDKHEALESQPIPLDHQRDFVRGVQTVQDTMNGTSFNHGTWVLGCLAGNKLGAYVGAAYGAQFALARTEVAVGETPQEMVNWGLGAEWADSLGADVISSSLGYFTFDNPFPDYTYADMNGHTTSVTRSAEIAASKGILVVNAVGNEGSTSWHYLIAPSDVHGDSLLAVGAVDASGVPESFSSYGPSADGRVKPDLAARGGSDTLVASVSNPSAYSVRSGTSFAAPLVAGLAACLIQARPTWTPREVSRALRLTASQASSPDNRVGYGVPDGLAALRYDATAAVPWDPARVRVRLLGPNPFRTGDSPLRFVLSVGGPVGSSGPGRLEIVDLQGRAVSRRLGSRTLTAGSPETITWDGRDDGGRLVAPGLYFIVLEASGERSTARVALLR